MTDQKVSILQATILSVKFISGPFGIVDCKVKCSH